MALAIERIEFSPWGCFADQPLDFGPEPGTVDLIYGENASGKSTTSRGERSLLYGIDAQTSDNHSHDYGALRIAARLRIDGETVELARHKKHPTLRDLDGNPLGADPVAAALGGLSEEVYRGLFVVDHETLVQGGIELLEGDGEIGASLFAAAAGIAHLHETLAAIDGEAEEIYKPRGRNTVLNKTLRELGEAEKEMREGLLRPKKHASLTQALHSKEERSGEFSVQIREIGSTKRAIERRRMIAPQLDSYADRAQELAGIAAVPELAAGAVEQRIEAQGTLATARRLEQRAIEQLAEIDAEIDAIEVDDELLALAEQVRDARDQVSKIEAASADRRKREGELAEARSALARAATVIGVTPEAVAELQRPATARRDFDERVNELIEARAALSSADRRRRTARGARERTARELKAGGEDLDLRPIEASVAVALKAGPLAQRLVETQAARDHKSTQAKEQLARLQPRPAGLMELRELHIPGDVEIVAAVAEIAAQDTVEAELSDEEARLARTAVELSLEREQLAAEGEVPSAGALADARERREAHWSAVRDSGEAGEPWTLASAEHFEQALAEADELSDRRLSGIARAERSATLEGAGKRLEQENALLAGRRQELRQRKEDAERSWGTVWQQTGLEEIGPRQATEWVLGVTAILDLDRGASENAATGAALQKRQGELAGAVQAELASLGENPDTDLELEALIAFAQRVTADARERDKRSSAAEATLKEAERQLADIEVEYEEVAATIQTLVDQWPARLEEAGLPPGSNPEAAQEIVRSVGDGLAQIARIADLERRIVGIDADRDAFEKQVDILSELSGAELEGLAAPRAADVLARRLREVEGRSSEREGLREQREATLAALSQAKAEIVDAESTLAALVAVAGCGSVEELPAIEMRWARAQELGAELREIEHQVTEAGEAKFADLVAAAEGFDRDAGAIEAEELEGRLEGLGAERDGLQQEIGEDKAALSEAEIDESAAVALQKGSLLLAEAESAARRYVIAKLGAAIVRRAMERYRRLHQDPLLQRANTLFSRFTLGTFSALEVDADAKGKPVLIGREGEVGKSISEMSKGTREQLFLALRLAAIERYVTTSHPLPVIFDDVFIESDEPRSEQIFIALGELARKAQVIVLTHHRHLIEVGKRALGDGLLVQELPQTSQLSPDASKEADSGSEMAVAAPGGAT